MEPITDAALEQSKQELFGTVEKRKRGRPPKAFVLQNNDTIDIIPSKPTVNNAAFLVAYPNILKDRFGRWKTTHVSETSEIFITWLECCQAIVDEEFGMYEWDLKTRKYSKFIWVVMEHPSKRQRPFAFIDKTTANIHCPATFDDPFDHYCGNIIDPETQYSVITPFGVKTDWAFLPTHPNNKPVK